MLRNASDLEDGIQRSIDLLVNMFGPRKPIIRMVISEIGAHDARRRSYTLLAAFLAHRLRAVLGVADPDALAWAIVGGLEIQLTRWAVWDELDLPTLRERLLATARAILPTSREPS